MPTKESNVEQIINLLGYQVVPRTVWYWDDATWILAASFIIFTMQTGFGMLESGIVSLKNQEST